MGGLKRYTRQGIKPGDFLCAVIRNDLRGAVERADDEMIHVIPAIVEYLYNHAPIGCWGHPGAIETWIKHMEDEV